MKLTIAIAAILLLIAVLFVCLAFLAAFVRLPNGVHYSAFNQLPPKLEPHRSWDRIEEGVHKVGTHIQPGIYRGISRRDDAHTSRTYCDWQRRSALSDDNADIIAARTDVNFFYVEIKPTDAYFVAECSLMPMTPMTELLWEPRLRDPSEHIPPGTHLVGIEIRPGRYWAPVQLGHCVIERLNGVSGDPAESIHREEYKTPDHPPDEPFFITVEPTDFALHTTCSLYGEG